MKIPRSRHHTALIVWSVLFAFFLIPLTPTPVARPLAAYAQAECVVNSGTGGNVKLRGGPGTDYPIFGQITPTTNAIVTGQITGEDGFVWWRTFSGGWVRADAATVSGACDNIPTVNPPPSYCAGREELAERPELSGPINVFRGSRFAVHYTEVGSDAATEDFVQAVVEAMDYAWQIQIDTLGWPPPPSDCGEGGDELFDVYLRDVEADGFYGFAVPEQQIGDNLNSAEVEVYAAYSHLILDNDYAGATNPLGAMRATAAHEFHHNIQMSYDIADAFRTLDEAGATWMESQVYPQYDASSGYLSEWFHYPDLCLGSTTPDQRRYAEWVLIDSIAQDFGPEAIRTLWRYRADYEGTETFFLGMEALGMAPEDAVLRMGVRNLLHDYERHALFPSYVDVEAVVTGAGRYAPRRDGVQPFGMDYVHIAAPDVYTFETADADMFLFGVGIRGNDADSFFIGQSGVVDTRPYDHFYVIVLNKARFEDHTTCEFADWTLAVSTSSDTPLAPNADALWVFDATNYLPPLMIQGSITRVGTMIDKAATPVFVLDLKAGDQLSVFAEAMSEGFDPLARLFTEEGFFDPAGEAIAEDDDGGGGLNSRLNTPVEAEGRYYLLLGTVGSAGDYQLRIAINGDAQDAPSGETTYSQKQSGDGERPANATPTPPTNAAILFEETQGAMAEDVGRSPAFELEAGDTVYIYAEGVTGDLDPVVYIDYHPESPLYDANAPVLAEDDDSGGGLNSLLTYRVEETASYQVVWRFLSGNGEYRVVVVVNDVAAFEEAMGK